jgi:hypothetical protein
MTLTEDQQRALVAQREREAIAVELAGLRRDATVAAVERAFCNAALAFADAKASIEDQANEYKRTLAALQAARRSHA